MPQSSEKLFGEEFDGAFWLRREIDVPADWAGKPLSLKLGPTTSAATAWFNGEKVFSFPANPDTSYPGANVQGNFVKPGSNTLVVRYFDPLGRGGVTSGNLSLFRISGPGDKDLPFAGTWLAKIESKLPPAKLPGNLPAAKDIPFGPYNAMIAPVEPFTCRGTLWYQGESNAGDPRYTQMMEQLITSWRAAFESPDMPFYFVQLANYMQRHKDPVDTNWAKCRETQRQVLASVPNTAMAVIIDVGDSKDIHPKNKQAVGHRLALPAMHFVYGEKDLEFTGPVLDSVEAKGSELLLTFSHSKGGLVAKDSPELKGFAISEDGTKFVWAKASIDGGTVRLSAESLKAPKFIRYAWDDDPDCNLYNKAGLPASPFQAKVK